jgi:Ca2+-binding EF-hand superfamily protein
METNGGEQITKLELKALLSHLGECVEDTDIDEMIKIADVNGKIDSNNFFNAATK